MSNASKLCLECQLGLALPHCALNATPFEMQRMLVVTMTT